MEDSVGSPALWIGFALFVAFMLTLDLGVFHRKAHEISVKEASIWSAVWIALALLFNGYIFLRFGAESGQAFFTGYLIEKALSVDNLFVFYMIFTAFRVPAQYQHRLLFWGIIGALIMRATLVWGGVFLLERVHWVVYVFGALLLATGVKMLSRPNKEPHPERSRVYRWLIRVMPTTDELQGQRFFARVNGKLFATPLLIILLLVELTDVVFALDSILAIFAITTDPFIVFTSNVMAVMGLRSLYFVLAGMAKRFAYLQPGLAMVLIFVGAKMAVMHWIKIPVLASLAVVALLLGGSIGASMIKNRRDARRAAAAG
jgi:tellurite resistance protein TerC